MVVGSQWSVPFACEAGSTWPRITGCKLLGGGLDFGHGQNKLGAGVYNYRVSNKNKNKGGAINCHNLGGREGRLDIIINLYFFYRESACPELPCTFWVGLWCHAKESILKALSLSFLSVFIK